MISEARIKEVGERARSYGELPSARDPDEVARAVYALYQHSSLARAGWDKAMDTNRRFYNGDQIKIRKTTSNIVDNQVKVAVGTIRPRIKKAIRKLEIKAALDGDVEAADMLSLRVEYGCKQSYLNDLVLPEAIDNMLIEGGAILKADKGVMVSSVDPKNIFWTPETGFDECWYIGQHYLVTIGELRAMFGGAAKRIGAMTEDLDNRKNERDEPPVTSEDASNNLIVSIAPVNESSPVRRYGSQSIGSSFVKARKCWLIEMWVLDRSHQNGVPVYPSGRLIDVAIGTNDDAGIISDEMETILDRPIPYDRLFQGTGRFHPFAYAPYDNRRGVWSNSLVTDLIPLQRGLNDAWNTWMKNAKLVNNPRMLAHASLGLKEGSVTNQAGEITTVPSEYNYPANTALTFLQVPSIAQHFVPIREAFLQDIRDVAGILDIMRGENPTGVTAGVALNVLDSNANERISSPATSLSLALAQIKEDMAYIAQELDDKPIELPDDSIDNDRETASYDPEASRDVSIRINSVENLPLEQVIAIMNAVADLEAKGLPGEMILRYVDDPTLHRLFVEKKQERVLAEQMAQIQEEGAMEQQAEGDLQRQITSKIADVAIQGQPQTKGGGANAVRK